MTDDDVKVLENLKEWGMPSSKSSNLQHEEITAAVALIERLAAEVERLTLVWSSERPTVAGDYKVRYAEARGNRWVRYIKRHDIAANDGWLDDLEYGPLEFAGPIAEPIERDAATKEAAR